MTQTGRFAAYIQPDSLPMLWPVCAWAAGVALARSDIVSLLSSALLLPLLALSLLILRRRTPALLLLLAFLWGTGDLLLDAGSVNVDQSWLATPASSSARIQQIVQTPAFTRLQLHEMLRDDGAALAGKALLYIYHNPSGHTELHAGDRIHFSARWHRPENRYNPGAFDYRAWCFDHHIALIGSIRGALQLLSPGNSALQQGRERISKALTGVIQAPAGVLRALLLGERSLVADSVNTAFAATGTAHLLAISGMHVGMVAASGMALLWWLLTRREAWIVTLPVRTLAMLGGIVAAMAYALIAGWPLPAVRAAIMLAAGVLALSLSARHAPLNILLAALGLILLFDPASVASLSLWLSFTATAALLLWATDMKTESRATLSVRQLIPAARTLLWVSLVATLATLPITLAIFGRLPVYTLLANLMLVPIYGLLVMPMGVLAELAALFNLPTLAALLMQAAGFAVEIGLVVLHWLMTLPAGVVWAVHPPLWLGGLYFAGMLFAGWLLLHRSYARAALLASLVVGLYTAAVLHERDVDAPLWVAWDVGQAAASTLLLPGGRVIVVDVPGRAGSRYNGGTTVAAGLRTLGFTHVDLLILSHAQADHLGGALSLLQAVNHIDEIWLPDAPAARRDQQVHSIIAQAAAQGTRVRWLARGDSHRLEDPGSKTAAALTILWPPRGFAPNNENNTSLVVSVALSDAIHLLWPGDIETASERALLASDIEAVGAMLMPHHGSRTSSTASFIRRLAPALAVAQTGAHNHYRFPAAKVVARYRSIGAEIRNTAEGAVMVTWRDSQPQARYWSAPSPSRREQAQHYWQWLKKVAG
ncbi:MAG: DNA internalization-related competence protein ComEC/Rec2 [Zetaproteobacteria bacterium CG12_big_fil_rev_8_21_14_0_65_54_13]|nr:MAG: DNA internalization-related competence protein ComEC/Rec2 [Zetaproteobacteria bacterium CG1_02_53_45]PIP02488.1 MAG: DNA internalization-related competence protein ComEC/Rec2 [Zetaproteobacteria bacterium CG23_combo_of_CG06-09_8_20_14_all_54_7]PIW47546.1 MAG: DNA internalization-related competence protein ComEC/Rec2 [Zetaproteobacteria bacterium CG12_big_fil_rev_8_21_14_0_65_54_13]PIX55215.1 MAG: DNA internalization-related competence protein ComEC/Rec2 [Zetaproteobacteria bacterium CG_4